MSDLVTTAKAAEIIGCTPGRIRQLVRTGEIPCEDMGPRMKLISRELCEKMAKNQAKTGRPRINAKHQR